ncbi:protease, Abi superfamily, putative [Geotalea daltonii FRC-32]|uniref:Protease, Abi superfamily, putative n=1 Tax=Geotalea daltonii (strain DSM 22248 / JCM 15807 / FRC-32) TaxID=316067 RepID=B9M6Y8_GEODF|nr:protease, Abi superfamily, putative [Geotalea daltonii FRC-32]
MKMSKYTKSNSLAEIIRIIVILILSFVVYFLLTLSIPNGYIDNSSTVILVYLPVIFYIYKRDTTRFKETIIKPISFKYAITAILFFIVLYAINYYWIGFGYDLSYLRKYTTFGLIVFLLVSCIIAPVVEEIIFRYYLYSISRNEFGIGVAFIISNSIFVAFHALDSNLGNIALQGIVYTYTFEKSKSIKSSIAAHIFNNCMWFLITYLHTKGPNWV